MSGVESSTMASVDSDVSCEMFCLDLCLLLGCGDVLVLEGAWRVLLGRGAYLGVSGCEKREKLEKLEKLFYSTFLFLVVITSLMP